MCHKIWEKNARFVLEKMFGMSQMPPLKSTWGGIPPPPLNPKLIMQSMKRSAISHQNYAITNQQIFDRMIIGIQTFKKQSFNKD